MRTIPGLEKCEIMRPAYAIEYDCLNPLELTLSLELKISWKFIFSMVNSMELQVMRKPQHRVWLLGLMQL